MTQWTTPTDGRERGLRGIGQAWIQVLTRPRAFFERAISPGDQGPALGFVVAVTAMAAATFVAFEPVVLPGGDVASGPASAMLVAAIAVLLAPTALHLVAAVQTVLLALAVPDRGGVSETVQILAYASAPCVVAGVPVPVLRVLATAYASLLLALGVASVHHVSLPRAALLTALPSWLAFGAGFGGFRALWTLLSRVGVVAA